MINFEMKNMGKAFLRATIFAVTIGSALPCAADDGYKFLFKSSSSNLSLQDKKDIYQLLGLKKSNQIGEFILDGCDPSEFEVRVQDLNGDKIYEVFLVGGNTCTSGMIGNSVWLFIKTSQRFRMNFGFPASDFSILAETNDGFPDIQFAGTGYCTPVWRWNGKSYALLKNIPAKVGGCDYVN